MISWLFHNLVCYIETAIVLVCNLLLVAIGALIAAIVSILPGMPTLPGMPSQVSTGLAYVEYILPLDWIAATVVIFFTLWLAWLALSIPLRWAKAIRGSQ
jgi:hypothetical protein